MGKDVAALHIIAYVFCTVMALLCLIPFVMVVSGSFHRKRVYQQMVFLFSI